MPDLDPDKPDPDPVAAGSKVPHGLSGPVQALQAKDPWARGD